MRADTQRRQQQLDQKLMDFTLEGRNANLLQKDFSKHQQLLKSENTLDDHFSTNQKSKSKAEILSAREESKFFTVTDKKESLNKSLKNTLREELKHTIDEYMDQQRVENLEATKQTFLEMFFSKFLRILSMIYIQKEEKFFQLIRKKQITSDDKNTFRNLLASYTFFKRNPDNYDQEMISSFIKSLLGYKPIQEEMVFFMDYQLGNQREVEKLIHLEDSLFERGSEMDPQNGNLEPEELSFSRI